MDFLTIHIYHNCLFFMEIGYFDSNYVDNVSI